VSTFFQEVRYAARSLLNNAGVTAAAIVCLALGIGATSAIFSVVHAVVLKPLGYREPDRLVRMYTEFLHLVRRWPSQLVTICGSALLAASET
jgi:hypothetical protein